jgi:hypothetical protein
MTAQTLFEVDPAPAPLALVAGGLGMDPDDGWQGDRH